jgi:hypothetical protein
LKVWGSYKKLDFCDSKIDRLALGSGYKDLIAAFFPTGTLDYFDIVKTTTDSTGLSIYLEESDLLP